MVKLQLPSSVSSPQDLASLVLEVHGYSRWFAQASVKKRVAGGSLGDPPELSVGATELIRSWAADKQLTGNSLDELVSALEDFKKTAPSLTVTLSAPAPGDLKEKLVTWFRQNIAPDILVTFKFNATLLGGMVVHYGSHIFDWSFRRQILAARAKFPEVLRRV